MSDQAHEKKRCFLVRAWKGEVRLWQAFWLLNVLGKFAFFTLLGGIGWLLWHGPDDTILVNVLLLPLALAYIGYVATAVWRSAPNTAHAALGALAKVWVIFYVAAWLLTFGRVL